MVIDAVMEQAHDSTSLWRWTQRARTWQAVTGLNNGRRIRLAMKRTLVCPRLTDSPSRSLLRLRSPYLYPQTL